MIVRRSPLGAGGSSLSLKVDGIIGKGSGGALPRALKSKSVQPTPRDLQWSSASLEINNVTSRPRAGLALRSSQAMLLHTHGIVESSKEVFGSNYGRSWPWVVARSCMPMHCTPLELCHPYYLPNYVTVLVLVEITIRDLPRGLKSSLSQFWC